MTPIAIAPPRPATAPATAFRQLKSLNIPPSGLRRSILTIVPPKQKGGRSLCRPRRYQRNLRYFRLVIAVRSADNLATPVAPHQLDWKPRGLMAETLPADAICAV